MIERLYQEAEASVNTPQKLRKRLRMTASVLIEEYRVLFPVTAFLDLPNRRLVSSDSKYYLQWVNTGETSIGSCYLVVRNASLGSNSAAE